MIRTSSRGNVWVTLLALVPLLVVPLGWTGECSMQRSECCRVAAEPAAPASSCCSAPETDLTEAPPRSPCECADATDLPPALPFAGASGETTVANHEPASVGQACLGHRQTVGFVQPPTPRAGAPAHVLHCVFLI